MKQKQSVFKILQATFLTGLLLMAPLAVTAWVLRGIYDRVSALSPFGSLGTLAGTALTLLIILVFILFIGWLSRTAMGSILSLVDDILARVPGVSFVYNSVSAYFMLRFNQTKRKYYFIQDYEPLFYSGGSTYALAESTYRFGFNGIVNTPGLLRAVNQRHGLEGVSFVPAIDNRYYFAPEKGKLNKRIRIFFYARPNNPRNAFELGVLIIQQLIELYSDRIEIITAGAKWDESKYELKGKITNLGLINGLSEVGKLYRSCDIGFVYMLSKHPSYQPFEFMASGMATVTNNNEDNLWFLRDGTNCLIAEPSAAAMAEKIGWLIDDENLRHKIQDGGYKSVSTDWESKVETIWNDVIKSQR